MNKRKSQSILDFIFAFVGILILVIGIARIMVWFNANFAAREVAFQKTRLQAGTPTVQDARTDLVSVVPFRPLELTEEWVFKGELGQQVEAWRGGIFNGAGFSPTECINQCSAKPECFDAKGKFDKNCSCYVRCICVSRIQPMINAMTSQVQQYCGVNEDCNKIARRRCGDGMACSFWRNGNSMWDKAKKCDDPWEICWWGNWGKTASELKKAARKLWELAAKFEAEGRKLKQKRDGMKACCNQNIVADQQRCFCNIKEENPQKQLECRCSTYQSVAEQAQCMCGHIVDAGLRQACIDSIDKKIYSLTPFVPEEQCQRTCSGQVGCGVYPNNFNTSCQCFGQCVCGANVSAAFDGAISGYCGSDLNCNKVQLDADCKTCANSPVSCKSCYTESGCAVGGCEAYILACQKCGALSTGNRAKCVNCLLPNSGMACDYCMEGRTDENFTEAQCAQPWRDSHPIQNCKKVGFFFNQDRFQWCKIWFQDFWGDGWWCWGESSPVFDSQEGCENWCNWQWLVHPCPPGDAFFVGADYMLGYLVSYKSSDIIESAGRKVVNQKEQYRQCCLKPTQAQRTACINALNPPVQQQAGQVVENIAPEQAVIEEGQPENLTPEEESIRKQAEEEATK
ncbi:MAG: hypothetical protein HZC15_07160 [Candidatus Omnitrophica bacterium]|nr:hypothetical protein [Candidatus Omnitrophota bacterium]